MQLSRAEVFESTKKYKKFSHDFACQEKNNCYPIFLDV